MPLEKHQQVEYTNLLLVSLKTVSYYDLVITDMSHLHIKTEKSSSIHCTVMGVLVYCIYLQMNPSLQLTLKQSDHLFVQLISGKCQSFYPMEYTIAGQIISLSNDIPYTLLNKGYGFTVELINHIHNLRYEKNPLRAIEIAIVMIEQWDRNRTHNPQPLMIKDIYF